MGVGFCLLAMEIAGRVQFLGVGPICCGVRRQTTGKGEAILGSESLKTRYTRLYVPPISINFKKQEADLMGGFWFAKGSQLDAWKASI